MRTACCLVLILAISLVVVPTSASCRPLPGQVADNSGANGDGTMSISPAAMKGLLGSPLGTVVTVEGIAAGDDYRRMREDMGCTLLRIERINGKPLAKEIVFRFHSHELARIAAPAVGARFKFVGYETGGFSGIPEGAFEYIPRVATTGFGFSTTFLVLKSLSGSR